MSSLPISLQTDFPHRSQKMSVSHQFSVSSNDTTLGSLPWPPWFSRTLPSLPVSPTRLCTFFFAAPDSTRIYLLLYCLPPSTNGKLSGLLSTCPAPQHLEQLLTPKETKHISFEWLTYECVNDLVLCFFQILWLSFSSQISEFSCTLSEYLLDGDTMADTGETKINEAVSLPPGASQCDNNAFHISEDTIKYSRNK